MDSLILTWVTAALFVMTLFWGTNVPTERRYPAVYSFLGLLVLFNLYAQANLFYGDKTMASGPAALQAAEAADIGSREFLSRMTFIPGGLRETSPSGWYRVITSSLLHYGWLHLMFNAWFFVLFGVVLERILGSGRLTAVVAAGLLIPAGFDGWFPLLSGAPTTYVGGFSGVVYAVLGAFLVCFPRAKCYGAFCYDLKYWAFIFAILLPVTMVTRYAGLALTEMVIMLGMLGLFLLVQPEHIRFSVPVAVVILYKLAQDVVLIEPVAGQVVGNSFCRIGCGFVVGGAMGLLFNGVWGWNQKWDDETKNREPAKRGTGRTSVDQLEANGRKTIEGARIFLGQRVFVGDAKRAASFYRDTVIPKFPDLVLAPHEQMALARLLHFKGCEPEAMHAYENLLRRNPVPEENWVAWLKAAEYVAKLAPERISDARKYLDRFEEGSNILMRDRIEAEQLRAAITGNETDSEPDYPIQKGSRRETGTSAQQVNLETVDASTTGPAGKRDAGTVRGRNAFKEQLDFPKSAPRTFHYNVGGETVSLGLSQRKRAEMVPLPAGDSVQAYWKPLPCVSQSKTLPSIMDRPVKSQQYVTEADPDRPTMYGTTFEPRTHKRTAGGRLSRLELVRKEVRHVPPSRELPRQYGGPEDDPGANAKEQPALRLRGEKEPPARMESRRAKSRRQAADLPTADWGRLLAPGDQMPEDKDGYGVPSETN